jgi:cathepsin C
MKCGHSEPSNEETSYLAKSPYEYKHNYRVNLKTNNQAELSMEGTSLIGQWTMVYDEGFSIQFDDLKFFAFSKYTIEDGPTKKIYKSQCYSTLVGWYSNKEKWGCYQAFKLGVDPNKVTKLNSKNGLNIVEPSKNNNEDIINSMLNMQFRSVRTDITFSNTEHKRKKMLKPNSSYIALEERESSMLKLDASFNKHALFINKINTVKKSWKAGLHQNFTNLSIRELNKYAGIPRIANKMRFKSIEIKPLEDVSMFPKNFDWKNKLKPAGSQGNCGSCYVYSTMRMVESRLKIKYDHDVDLSVQHALDCSYYNQGCSGGYPFLVMKFANEFQLIPEECKPYAVIVYLNL